MTDIILGIETSCDDTAVALVDSKGNVISSVVASQTDVHQQYGGVFPELASRAHITSILPVVDKVFKQANLTPQSIRAIGVTRGPGLIGSILVGLNTATALGMGWNKPVIGINHLRGHLRSADLEEQRIKFPAVILLVSGGHTFLAYMQDPLNIKLLGSTRDDSVGEAFDKVGRMLGLDYPAGPLVDKMAQDGQPTIPFPRPMLNEGLEFSLSGLKAAVERYMNANENPHLPDVAASFVQAIMDILIKKCRKAIIQNPCKSLVVVGGVAANSQLRAATAKLCQNLGVELCLPPLRWSMDNAAMIALATWDYIEAGIYPKPIPQLQLPIFEF